MKKVEITKGKVCKAINKMKNNKAAGPDGIKPEVFKEIRKEDSKLRTYSLVKTRFKTPYT